MDNFHHAGRSLAGSQVHRSGLGRGHRILIENGLQDQLCVPKT
jgi:hypothetical protein